MEAVYAARGGLDVATLIGHIGRSGIVASPVCMRVVSIRHDRSRHFCHKFVEDEYHDQVQRHCRPVHDLFVVVNKEPSRAKVAVVTKLVVLLLLLAVLEWLVLVFIYVPCYRFHRH
jgi:hypothetical protein